MKTQHEINKMLVDLAKEIATALEDLNNKVLESKKAVDKVAVSVFQLEKDGVTLHNKVDALLKQEKDKK